MLKDNKQHLSGDKMPPSQKAKQSNIKNEGWYVYDGKEVSGPFNDKTFSDTLQSNRNLFASKKGFSKWYKIEDLGHVLSATDEDQMNAEVKEFKKFFDRSMQKLEAFNQAHANIESKIKPTTIRKVQKAHIPSSLEQIMVEETIKARKSTDIEQREIQKAKTKQAVHKAVKQPSVAKVSKNPKELYLTLKGRLRLGQIVNTFDAGFVDYFFTLSLSSFFWLRRMRQEIVFHVWGNYTRGHFSDLLVLVPFVCCFKYYSIAKLISKAETQNQYKKVIPLFAFFLGLVPPLAISYLQEVMNRHWILHVVNVKRKQQ
jgi:hypothetical protein